MNESDFEGTVVLEKWAEINKVQDFLDAVDADDFAKVQILMRRANIDAAMIAIVLRKMKEADGEH